MTALAITRRGFGRGLGAAALATLSAPALALGEAKIVVIGGGAGGASVAGQLKRFAPSLNVTLVEANVKYTSCFFSNAYIGGFVGIDDLTHGYKGLKALGVEVVNALADRIDLSKREVHLKAGKSLSYDRLVVAPGIDFKWSAIAGYSEEAAGAMPHAWRGGAQSAALRRQLERMENGGTVVIAVPKLPYRCPPGPYERACVIANVLAREKPRSKVVILDAKMTFSKQAAFEEAFRTHYNGRIELMLTNDIDDQEVEKVDIETGEVRTRSGFSIKADVANIIPPQTAGRIAVEAGLASPDWCPVDPATFASTLAENVYVLGDAAIATDMPKSAFSANSQAHVVAGSVLASLDIKAAEPARLRNTCWSIVALDDAIKIGADYKPGVMAGNKPGLVAENAFVSKPGESAEERRENFQEAFAWYPTLVGEIFNKPVAELRPRSALLGKKG
ncbi:MAG: NAD(P)/FAD-dependent oxidoreductase [Hyphomicrobium sp.]|nr:NAD(P)/FAD-dependent oxidoreductase [Hyphomicrobium sp.]